MTTVLVSTTGISLLGINLLSDAFSLFTQPDYIAYPRIVSERLFQKAILQFIFFSVCVLIITLPIALFVFRAITAPYTKVLKELSTLASERLNQNNETEATIEEKNLLEHCCTILTSDLDKLQDYEKIAGWKKGARMLLHEIKNPLTPLKLTTEHLLLSSPSELRPDLKKMHLAITDCEKVLHAFQELITLTFPPKRTLFAHTFITETFALLEHKNITYTESVKPNSTINSDDSLLRIVVNNLVNNGLEANQNDFHIQIEENSDFITFLFITPKQNIPDLSRIFKIGYSTKETRDFQSRGYGLYITHQIIQYLDHDLSVEQNQGDLVFKLRIQKL